jgi:hypothetical protein
MQLTNLRKRVAQLEGAVADLTFPSREQKGDHDLHALIARLLTLEQNAIRIEKRAISRGDDATALCAIRELCRIAELIARLRGQLEEGHSTNIVNVNIDANTAQRIAEIYATRHAKTEKETL